MGSPPDNRVDRLCRLGRVVATVCGFWGVGTASAAPFLESDSRWALGAAADWTLESPRGRALIAISGLLVFSGFYLRWRRHVREEDLLRARMERERTLERRYTKLTENAADLIATLDSAGRITTLNRAGTLLIETTGAEARGLVLAATLNTADRAPFEAALREALAGGDPLAFEVRLPRRDGTHLDLEVVARASGLDGGPPEIQCIARDITSRKRIEAAAREAIQRQRVHVENTPLGVIEWNSRFEVVAWNPAAERIFGWSPSEALGRTADFVTPVSERRQIERRWSAVVTQRGGREALAEGLTRDGRSIQCQWYHTPLVSPEGTVVGVASLVQDVTEERVTAARLEESEEHQRLVLSALAEGVLVVDSEGRVFSANDGAGRITGFPADQMSGTRMQEWGVGFLEDDGREVAWEKCSLSMALRELEDAQDWRMGLRRPDGRTAWISGHVRSFPVTSRRGAGARIVSFADVTAEHESAVKRDLLEAQLRQSQKMESLGTLAGGVAHDFNNVLAMILGNAELLRADVHGMENRRRLDDIAAAARRGAEVVSRILVFSRPQATCRTPLRLSSIVGDVLQLVRVSLPPHLDFQIRISPDEPSVLGDAAQLRQLLLNLVTNAAQAMEGRPDATLTVRIECSHPDPDRQYLLGQPPVGPAVCLSVIDNGPGMPLEVQRRLFEPFFTTKPPGKGTGLGLAVVHGIVFAHEGALRVESAPGSGARFDIDFPAGPDAAPEPVPPVPGEAPRGRSERILLVDDEEGVLNFSRTALTRLGYQVSGFTDPAEALEEFRRMPAHYDLVLTDLTMPHLTGSELAAEIRRCAPSTPVILASGYAARGELEDGGERNFAAMLGKPYRIADLGRVVRGTLDGREKERPATV